MGKLMNLVGSCRWEEKAVIRAMLVGGMEQH